MCEIYIDSLIVYSAKHDQVSLLKVLSTMFHLPHHLPPLSLLNRIILYSYQCTSLKYVHNLFVITQWVVQRS